MSQQAHKQVRSRVALRLRYVLVLIVLAISQLISCRPKTLSIELFMDTDVPRDRGMSIFVSARSGVSRGPILPFPETAMFFRFDRGVTDAGVNIPGSVVIQPSMADSTAFIEVTASVERTSTAPALVWRQYAVVQATAGASNTVRMFLSQRCASPARGCLNLADIFCTAGIICTDRGLTCGEDGQCVRPEGWATFNTDAGMCGNNRCGPGCPACAAGTGCSDGGFCTPTPDGSVPCRDEDHDGFGVGFACIERDCNDRDRDSYPGAVELCDSKDNDCNGVVDDGACVNHTNTSCPTATPIDITAPGPAVVLHPDTSRGAFGANVTCNAVLSNAGKQLWYAITYPQNEILDVRAMASTNPDSHPVLFLQRACDQSLSLVCSESTLRSLVNPRVVLLPEPGAMPGPTTVYLLLGGYVTQSNGPTRLEISHSAPVPATCAQPFNVGVGGAIGAVALDTNVLPAVCAAAQFGDAVYQVQPTALCAITRVISTDPAVVLYDVCPPPRVGSCFNANGVLWSASVPVNLAIDGVRPGNRYIATFTASTEACNP